MRVRYPRTPHVPWSPGATRDDERASDASLSALEGREVVVTEKLDGENTTLYRDGLHARSLDSAHHPSRAWVKALHGRIASRIPTGTRVSGENLFARHSIAYGDLDSYFYAFSIWDADDRCLGWDETVRFAEELGVPVPRVLYRGPFDARRLRRLAVDTAKQEGWVLRTTEGFHRADFGRFVAKWVRPAHVTTDEHWMRAAVVPNGLGARAALFNVRSGAGEVPEAVARAAGLEWTASERASAAWHAMEGRLDAIGRRGSSRLEGLVASLAHDLPRGPLLARLTCSIGMPSARRVADLIGLAPRLSRPFPDVDRRAGLARMCRAADLGVLHALAAAILFGADEETRISREHVAWSELWAGDAGLLSDCPYVAIRDGLRAALAGGPPLQRDRCFAEALERWAEGRLVSPEEAAIATFSVARRPIASAAVMAGVSGSGKSTFARVHLSDHRVISLDDLREGRGARADQSANDAVLREGLRLFDAGLGALEHTAWDATGLDARQRALPLATARGRDALTSLIVFATNEETLRERNRARGVHSIPEEVLRSQLRRWSPPYACDADRVVYVGDNGAILDVAGGL